MNIQTFPPEVIEALVWPFDFDVRRASASANWYKTDPPAELIELAGEASGGVYARLNTDEIVFIDSEGGAGIIAPNLESAMLLLVCHPYWRDLLKFSGAGSLAEMRRTQPLAERTFFEDLPEARDLGDMIRDRLRLPKITDVVESLHNSVTSSTEKLILRAPDGSEFSSLFGRFTADRNPSWRRELGL